MSARNAMLAGFAAVSLGACGGGGGQQLSAPAVDSITVSPGAPTLVVGDQLQLTVTLKDASGRVLSGRIVRWSSLNPSTASVNASGMVTALAIGEVEVTASAESRQGSARVVVVASVDPPATVDRVDISPASVVVAEGATYQFTAIPRDARGKALPGRGMHWTTPDANVALVDGAGLMTALRTGATTVAVRVEGKSAQAGVRIEADYPFELVYDRTEADGSATLYALDISDPAAVAMPLVAGVRNVVASPDGSRIAYVRQLPWGSVIEVADRDGKNPLRLTEEGSSADQPAWSPDGMRLAYRNRVPGFDADIWTMSALDGSDAVNLSESHGNTNQGWPAWSPKLGDGSYRIAYSHSQGGLGHIWTMRSDGSDKQAITASESAYDDFPNWSPDGSRVVFVRSGDGIFADLYVVGATGGGGSLLMRLAGPLPGSQFAPVWSPDGQLIAFTSKHASEHFQVYTVWSDGTRLTQRTSDSADHANPAWLFKLATL